MAQTKLTQLFSPVFPQDSGVFRSLGEEFHLCENGTITFHWSDFFETCDQIKDKLDTDPELKQDFERKEKAIERLKLIPVWIQTTARVYQTTMFSLYERHILNRNNHMDGLDFFGPLAVSMISGTGPFKSMAVSEFFNKDMYQDFIMVSLIKGLLPKRDFRIRLKAKVLMEYGDNFEQAGLLQLEQLTTQGLLFSVDSDLYLKEVSRSNGMRVLLDTTTLGESVGKNLPELQEHLSRHVFNLMYSSRKQDAMELSLEDAYASSSFEFLKNNKKYLFVPYKTLSSHDPEGIQRIVSFVEYTKELVRENYATASYSKVA